MKNKIAIAVKLVFAAILSLAWLILIQGEYEMLVKPELQNDFPVIKGIGAVYFLGLVLLIIGAIVASLLISIRKNK